MYTFLTDEWIDAARELRAKYADRLPDVTIEVRINQVVTDVPFGDGTIRRLEPWTLIGDSIEKSTRWELEELSDAMRAFAGTSEVSTTT